ncbi:MAG: hypothetical protein IJD92_01930 [Bacilli bacterium]|nr:hypothetical protein [Bacilli bacterium]
MKRILLIVCFMLCTVGCTNINKMNYKDIVNETIKKNSNNKIYNRSSKGYKYYLPKYMSVIDDKDYNEKISSNKYSYYLFIDIISYYNNSKITCNNDSYYFSNNNIEGCLKVNNNNDKYYIEIIYNYAKIEVKVDKEDINNAINNSIIILSTIKYDRDIIDNLIGDNNINSKEENLSIFDNNVSNDNFLDIMEEYDKYEEEEDVIPDYDIIN